MWNSVSSEYAELCTRIHMGMCVEQAVIYTSPEKVEDVWARDVNLAVQNVCMF